MGLYLDNISMIIIQTKPALMIAHRGNDNLEDEVDWVI